MKIKLILIFIIFMILLICNLVYSNLPDYCNYYSIPENYKGWLVIREMPFPQSRPRSVTFIFNRDGFITTNYKMTGYFFTSVQYYRRIDGTPLTFLDIGDDLRLNVINEKVYFWYVSGAGREPSKFHEGEYWSIYYVGTIEEFRKAREEIHVFLKRYFT